MLQDLLLSFGVNAIRGAASLVKFVRPSEWAGTLDWAMRFEACHEDGTRWAPRGLPLRFCVALGDTIGCCTMTSLTELKTVSWELMAP